MHTVPAVPGLGEQALGMELVQQSCRAFHRDSGQRRRRVRVHAGARVQPEAVEELAPGRLQVLAGHLERGRDAGMLGGERQQRGSGLGDEVRQRPRRMSGIYPGQQADRQRQVAGHRGKLSDGGGISAGAGSQPDKHLLSLTGR